MRKWYERELLQGHAHLALTFVCMVGVFAAFEAATTFRSRGDQLADLGSGPEPSPSDASGDEVQVRCRKCSQRWHISA